MYYKLCIDLLGLKSFMFILNIKLCFVEISALLCTRIIPRKLLIVFEQFPCETYLMKLDDYTICKYLNYIKIYYDDCIR